MRSSREIKEIFEAEGLTVTTMDFGTSYRAGGALLITPADWSFDRPAKIIKAESQAFDGTGYDGRGRKYDIYTFKADEAGFVEITEGKFFALPEAERLQIGSEGRSGEVMYFGNPEADDLGDLADVFGALGL